MIPQATTQIFRGTPAGYVRRVAVMWLWRRWWVWALPVVACCVAAVWWPVWIFVALMLIFLLYPSLMMMIYFYHAMSPEAQRALLPQSVTVSNNGITVDYHDERKTPSEIFKREEIMSITSGKNGITVRVRGPHYRHIYIPASAFPQTKTETSLFDKFISSISPDNQPVE